MSRFGHVQSARRSGRSGRGKPNANDDHRHLNESQRSMVAARVRPHFEKLAKERQRAAIQERDEKGRAKSTHGQLATSGKVLKSLASEEAGMALSVSRRSVDRARVVQGEGVPELAKKVEAGEMSLSKAATWTPTSCRRSSSPRSCWPWFLLPDCRALRA